MRTQHAVVTADAAAATAHALLAPEVPSAGWHNPSSSAASLLIADDQMRHSAWSWSLPAAATPACSIGICHAPEFMHACVAPAFLCI